MIHGGLLLAFVILMLIFMTIFMSSMPGPGAPPPFVMVFMWLFMGGFYGLMTLPSLVAGYGLLKQKPWARTWSIISAVTAAMSFPIGTAVCAYTFWFLFSEPGKLLYDRPRFTLPAFGNLPEAGTQQRRDDQYLPPPTPPDWR